MFFSPFSIAITSLGEERANLSAFHTFVRFALVWFCLFPLPFGVWEGLFVIVALLFSYLFFQSILAGQNPRPRPRPRPKSVFWFVFGLLIDWLIDLFCLFDLLFVALSLLAARLFSCFVLSILLFLCLVGPVYHCYHLVEEYWADCFAFVGLRLGLFALPIGVVGRLCSVIMALPFLLFLRSVW